jgi:hypothetical protein
LRRPWALRRELKAGRVGAAPAGLAHSLNVVCVCCRPTAMATDVGQLPPLPSDGCDVEEINDEEVLRRMVSTLSSFPASPLCHQ